MRGIKAKHVSETIGDTQYEDAVKYLTETLENDSFSDLRRCILGKLRSGQTFVDACNQAIKEIENLIELGKFTKKIELMKVTLDVEVCKELQSEWEKRQENDGNTECRHSVFYADVVEKTMDKNGDSIKSYGVWFKDRHFTPVSIKENIEAKQDAELMAAMLNKIIE